jgi:hypothetical protein
MVVGVPEIVPFEVLKVSPAGSAGDIVADVMVPALLRTFGVIALW